MSKWTMKWPTKPGHYWFFGWPYGRQWSISGELEAPELNHVLVWEKGHTRGDKNPMCIRDGHFWFKAERGIGLFLKFDPPELPDVSGMVKPKEKQA